MYAYSHICVRTCIFSFTCMDNLDSVRFELDRTLDLLS